jgi:hypothetical protein
MLNIRFAFAIDGEEFLLAGDGAAETENKRVGGWA